jgi:hypothetical protein
MFKLTKEKIAIFVLAVLFLSCLTYICVSKYKESRDIAINKAFTDGAKYGYQSAVEQLIQNAEGCKPVDVFVENKSLQLVDASCIK